MLGENLRDSDFIKLPEKRKIDYIRRNEFSCIFLKQRFKLNRLAPLVIYSLSFIFQIAEITAVFVCDNHIFIFINSRSEKPKKRINCRYWNMPVIRAVVFFKHFRVKHSSYFQRRSADFTDY